MTTGNTTSINQVLLVIVTLALSFALGQILPEDAQPWILITLGVLALGYVLRQFIFYSERGKPVRDYLQSINRNYYWITLGTFILVIGVLMRFAPSDIGLVFVILGIILLISSAVYFFNLNSAPKKAALNGENVVTNSVYNNSLADGFKEKVTEEILGHARRASLLSFGVAIGLFIIGIGIFVFIGISVYQMLGDDSQSFLFSNFTTEFIGRYRAGLPDIEVIGILFLIQIVALFPIIGLILIGWLGSKFIINATRLSQRKAIQDTLTEIGPLDAILAGVSINQAPTESIERNLKQARRALRTRKAFGTLLFLAGIGLIGWLLADGAIFGFKDVAKMTVLGSVGTGFLLVALFLHNANQTRAALRDITQLEMELAQQAQRSQIVNLYVAHLAKDGFKNQNTEELKQVLNTLNAVQPAEVLN